MKRWIFRHGGHDSVDRPSPVASSILRRCPDPPCSASPPPCACRHAPPPHRSPPRRPPPAWPRPRSWRSEEHTSELQSLMRISYAVFCLKKKKQLQHHT